MAESIFDGILWPVPEPPKPDPIFDHPFVKPVLDVHAQIKDHEHVQSLFSKISELTGLEVDHHHGTTALVVTSILLVLIVFYLLFLKPSAKVNQGYLRHLVDKKILKPHASLGEDSDISWDLWYYNLYADTVVEHMSPSNTTLLHLCCQTGNVKQVECLLKRGGQKDAKDSNGTTPAMMIDFTSKDESQGQWSQLMFLLLSYGHSPNFQIKALNNKTLLEYIVESQNKYWISLLCIMYNAERPSKWVRPDVNMTSTTNDDESSILKGSGGSLLHTAVKNDDLRLCRFLLSNGINVNTYDKNGIPAIMYANSEEIILLLIENGNDNTYVQPENKTTLLHIACEHNLVSVVEKLMSLNRDLREKAEAFKKADIAGSDIMSGYVNIDAIDINNTTPLQFASGAGREGVENMMLLLAEGADPNHNDNTNQLPILYKAIVDMNNSLVSHLVRGRTPPNDRQMLADVNLVYQDEALERRNALHYVTYGKLSPELRASQQSGVKSSPRRSSISALIGSVSDVFSSKKERNVDLPSTTARVSDTDGATDTKVVRKSIRKSIRTDLSGKSNNSAADGVSSDDDYGDGDFEEYDSDVDGPNPWRDSVKRRETKAAKALADAAAAADGSAGTSTVETSQEVRTEGEKASAMTTAILKGEMEVTSLVPTEVTSEVDERAMLATPPPASSNNNSSGYEKTPIPNKTVNFQGIEHAPASPSLDMDIIHTSTSGNDTVLTPKSDGGNTPTISTPVGTPIPSYKGTTSTMSEIDIMNGIAYLLLKGGCDPDYCDSNNISAIQLAEKNGYAQIATTMKGFSKKPATTTNSVFSARRWSVSSANKKNNTYA